MTHGMSSHDVVEKTQPHLSNSLLAYITKVHSCQHMNTAFAPLSVTIITLLDTECSALDQAQNSSISREESPSLSKYPPSYEASHHARLSTTNRLCTAKKPFLSISSQ